MGNAISTLFFLVHAWKWDHNIRWNSKLRVTGTVYQRSEKQEGYKALKHTIEFVQVPGAGREGESLSDDLFRTAVVRLDEPAFGQLVRMVSSAQTSGNRRLVFKLLLSGDVNLWNPKSLAKAKLNLISST